MFLTAGIGAFAGAALMVACMRAIAFFRQKRTTDKASRALSSHYGSNMGSATFHPDQNMVTWNIGNLVAKFYYFPSDESSTAWSLYHINDAGERMLVDSHKLDEWLNKQRLGATNHVRELVGSSLD